MVRRTIVCTEPPLETELIFDFFARTQGAL